MKNSKKYVDWYDPGPRAIMLMQNPIVRDLFAIGDVGRFAFYGIVSVNGLAYKEWYKKQDDIRKELLKKYNLIPDEEKEVAKEKRYYDKLDIIISDYVDE